MQNTVCPKGEHVLYITTFNIDVLDTVCPKGEHVLYITTFYIDVSILSALKKSTSSIYLRLILMFNTVCPKGEHVLYMTTSNIDV